MATINAVTCLGERPLGAVPVIERQGRVRKEGRNSPFAQRGADFFDQLRESQNTSRFSPRWSDAITVAALFTDPT